MQMMFSVECQIHVKLMLPETEFLEMTREELGQSLNLIEELIPETNSNRTGRQLRPGKIAVHNTDNETRGADALAHSRYLIQREGNSGYGPTSWHYTVDDTRVVKHLPLGEQGYHAYASGNRVSLGIEMCMNVGSDWSGTVDRTARLIAVLCFDFGWNVSVVQQHHDFPRRSGSRKNCPSRIRNSSIEPDWEGFVSLVFKYFTGLLKSEGFVAGFADAKGFVETEKEGYLPTDLTGDEQDDDHGIIFIPEELLSKE